MQTQEGSGSDPESAALWRGNAPGILGFKEAAGLLRPFILFRQTRGFVAMVILINTSFGVESCFFLKNKDRKQNRALVPPRNLFPVPETVSPGHSVVLFHQSLLFQQPPGGLSDFKGKPRSYFWDLSQATVFVVFWKMAMLDVWFEIRLKFEKMGKLAFMWLFSTKEALKSSGSTA